MSDPVKNVRENQTENQRILAAYERRSASVVAERYTPLDPFHLLNLQSIERRMIAILKRSGMTPLATRNILELGCGNGKWLREFIKWGASPARITGIDLLEEKITEARRLSPREARLSVGNAAEIDLPDHSQDIIVQVTMFSSILSAAMRVQVAGEMTRLLAPGGLILWYDFFRSNPRNADVIGITKGEMARLFAGCSLEAERVTLAPPLGRFLAPRSRMLFELAASVPLLRTHYLVVVRGQET